MGFSSLINLTSPFPFKGCWVIFFIFIHILIGFSVSKKMQRSGASDLGMHCLRMSNKNDARIIWIKGIVR